MRRWSRNQRWTGGALVVAVAGLLGLSAAPAIGTTVHHHGGPRAVVDGSARFEVLTPTLIRLEYAGDGRFQDGATFNVLTRALPVTPYKTWTAGGHRYIQTSKLTLSYLEGSGPFTPANTAVRLDVAGKAVTANPKFGPTLPSCSFGALCEAEDGQLTGGTQVATDHNGYTGSGFVAGYEATGAADTIQITGVPAAGTYTLAVRYANNKGSDGQTTTRTLSALVGGQSRGTFSLPPTASWDDWATASVTVHLVAGPNTISIAQTAQDSGKVNVDSLAVTPVGTAYPAPSPAGGSPTLGGYRRSLDGQSGPAPLAPGLLSRDGWYLLDDSGTALFNPVTNTITPRPSYGGAAYQDGYFFGYGDDYKQALNDLRAITGPADLLPESAFGVWYSRYYPYTTADYENTVLPAFRANHTPIDWLVVDTDWKSPNQWDGWNWNPALFSDPQAFLNWAHGQGLDVAMNIHPSISQADPQYAKAQSIAKNKLSCSNGTCTFDWSDPDQLAAYFALHQPFQQQGVDEWWLDWCCDNSQVSAAGVTPDTWINDQYAADGNARGQRGFAFSRAGSSLQAGGYAGSAPYPSGAWAEHRYTLQFTGDTFPTWNMLAFEAEFTADEGAAIGLPYVTHDIGSFHGGHDPEDLYARWVQFGAFQPVLRLHSDHGDRLPWNYGTAAQASAEQFLRLREALVPYTYTLAKQARDTGVPMVRAMYLDYPGQAAAYQHPDQYLYGDDVLVAPITSPNDANGQAGTQVWFPPGNWTDYFTGRTYTGPSTATVTDGLNAMPVFLRNGGMMVQRTNNVDDNAQRPLDQLTVDVAAGGNGAFTLYEDSGQGTGYQHGQAASTPMTWTDHTHTLTIGATEGSYPGRVADRTYTLDLYAATSSGTVTVDGKPTPAQWNPATHTLTVTTGALSTAHAHTVTVRPGTIAGPTG